MRFPAREGKTQGTGDEAQVGGTINRPMHAIGGLRAEKRPTSITATTMPSQSRRPAIARRSADGNRTPGDDRPADVRFDQYYTRRDVSRRLYEVLLRYIDPAEYLMVEPSAETGSFFRLMPPGSLAHDIQPKYPGIEEADFLEVELDGAGRKIAVVGNPPFGTQSRLALRFVNRAADQKADIVALILPRTFRKAPMQNDVDPHLHLIHEEIVPDRAFLFRGRPYDVPAAFQIWKRRDVPREPWLLERTHPDFDFTAPDPDTFGLQRVGARAGMMHDDRTMSPRSHYFIRAHHGRVRRLMEELRDEFVRAAGNVAGQPSLSKSEIVSLYKMRVALEEGRRGTT